jgi:hypothetical protein
LHRVAIVLIVAMLVLGLATIIPVHALDQKVFITTSTTGPIIKSTINDYTNTTHVGDAFTVYLMYSNMTDLYGIQYTLSWNNTILTVTSIKDTLPPWASVFIAQNVTNPGQMKFTATSTSGSYNEPTGFGNVLRKVVFKIMMAPPAGAGSFITTGITLSNVKFANSVPATIPCDITNGTFNYYYYVPPPVGATKLFVNPSSIINPSLLPGSTLTVDVDVLNVTNLYGYEFRLLYDTSFLNGIGILIYPQPPNETHFTSHIQIDDRNGMVFVNVTYFPPAEAISTITAIKLATITFQVQSFGLSTLHLNQTKLVDNQGAQILHTTSDGLIIVAAPDVAILKITVQPTVIYPGTNVNINVVAANLGIFRNETFDVTAYYNATEIATVTVKDLPPLTNTTLPFLWNTASIQPGTCVISARASSVPLEQNLTNNFLSDGTVVITRPDVAVLKVTPDFKAVYQGWKINISVVAANLGLVPTTFTVTAYYNGSNVIGTETVTNLASNTNTTLLFPWNTTGIPYCHNYTISAKASILPFEINVSNNVYVDGGVKIRIPGDVNGDGTVDVLDLLLISKAFGTMPGDPNYNMYADINRDGSIDVLDMILVSLHMGISC